jgi:hypothetical protein
MAEIVIDRFGWWLRIYEGGTVNPASPLEVGHGHVARRDTAPQG